MQGAFIYENSEHSWCPAQFIKAAVISMELKKIGVEEIVIHTGHPYDNNMGDIFFEDLGISMPNYNLSIGSGNHGEQTGKMLANIEKVLLTEALD